MTARFFIAAIVFASLLAVGCERTSTLEQFQQEADTIDESTNAAGSSTLHQAQEHAAKIDEALNSTVAKDTIPTGCYMRAVINGQKWEATAMSPDVSIPSIVSVNGRKDGSLITFTTSGKPDNVGQPRALSDMYTITYFDGNEDFFGAKSGQITVRKLDDNFLEGTFNFTVEENGKKITCTDGEFRIPSPTKKLVE